MPRPVKPEGTKNVRINISLTAELERKLREYAEKHERPLSWIVQKALIEWLAAHS